MSTLPVNFKVIMKRTLTEIIVNVPRLLKMLHLDLTGKCLSRTFCNCTDTDEVIDILLVIKVLCRSLDR